MSKRKTQKTRRHPIHIHIGLYIALAALAVTAAKTTGGIMHGVYAIPVHYSPMDSHMREAETLHGHAQYAFARRPMVSGY